MLPILEIQNISKQYRLGYVGTGSLGHDIHRWWCNVRGKEDPYLKIGEENNRTQVGTSEYVWALRDINLQVQQGEVLGIIGANGAGKSTLLKILSRVTGPTTGKITARGRIASLLEVGTGFHGELTGRENIYLNGAILGMTKKEITSKLDEIIDFSGCERYIDTPVKRYSSGMYVRLAFAVAAHLEPEILIVDEVLAVGDAEFQKKAIGKMKDVSSGQGRTVLFVSHNMTSVERICNRGIYLENGMISHSGDINSIINHYLNSVANQYSISQRGIGGVHVKRVSFYNTEQQKIESISSQQSIIIEMECEAEKQMDNLSFAICFNDMYDNRIMSLWSALVNKTSYSVNKGVFIIIFHVPSIKLMPGEYNIVTYVGQNSSEIQQINNFSKIIVTHNQVYDISITPSLEHGKYIENFTIDIKN